MSTRCRLITLAAVCAMLNFVPVQVHAANETAESVPLWSGLVPEDAFNAVVIYPRRVLTSDALAKLDLKTEFEGLKHESGVSILDFEEIVVLAGPMAADPIGHGSHPSVAYIVRLSKAYDSDALLKKWLNKPERYLVAGHRVYRREQTENARPSEDPGFCFLDDRTFVVSSQDWLQSILSAKDVKSPLVNALNKTDTSADLTDIFVNSDTVKQAVAANIPMDELPPPLKPVGELPNLLSATKLTIHTSPEISLRITLVGNDEAAAGKIADTVKSLQQTAQQMLPMLQAPPGPNMPEEERKTRDYAATLAGKAVDQLVPHQSGKQVTVEIKNLGTLDALANNLILPPMRRARAMAGRFQDLNNLRQIALAMQMALTADGRFPAHAIFSKDGKPLLSWRVQILQYVEQKDLYNRFHLDEPWDSAHNKPLVAKMPDVYKSHTGKPLAEGLTRFVVPVGKDTIFDGNTGIRSENIPDGTSNTILALEVGSDKAVVWTKPDDMQFDAQKPLAGLGTIGDSIPAALADGSVHSLRADIAGEKFRDLILRNDGHVVDWSNIHAQP